MSHFSEVARPAMRRKSSAQNILSSFKSATSSSQSLNTSPPLPPPISTGVGTISSVTGMSLASALASATTPTAPTLLGRGDSGDAQSVYTDNVVPNFVGATSPPLIPGTSVEFLRELIHKRLVTLTYIRNVHEGRSHWFHTLLVTRTELEKVFNNNDMKKRTYRFAILGLSLSNLLDINNPQDLLRSLLNTVTEHDQSKEESDRPKMRIFKSKGVRRLGGSGIAEFSGSESTDASYLTTPHMPFPLDYHETVLSLLDVVSEVYNKISKILGPSSLPHTSYTLGPLASVTPHPGISYLFASEANNHSQQYHNTAFASLSSYQPSQYLNSSSNPNLHQQVQFPSTGGSSTTLNGGIHSGDHDPNSSLWSIANASVGMGGLAGYPQLTINWSAAQSEMISKIDAKLKKVTSILLKDLDAFARNGIRDELASLDPLLRNIVSPEDTGLANGSGKIVYDFEGM